MQDKWIAEKKGYLKIYVAVNIKTKEILALEVTADEKVHEGKVIKQLIEQVLNNNHNITIKSFLGDGATTIAMRISNIFKRKGFDPSSK